MIDGKNNKEEFVSYFKGHDLNGGETLAEFGELRLTKDSLSLSKYTKWGELVYELIPLLIGCCSTFLLISQFDLNNIFILFSIYSLVWLIAKMILVKYKATGEIIFSYKLEDIVEARVEYSDIAKDQILYLNTKKNDKWSLIFSKGPEWKKLLDLNEN